MEFIVCFIVIGVLVLGIGSLDLRKVKLERETKRQSEVNLPLQREVERRWKDIVAKDIDEIHPEVENLYDYMRSLCKKYDVPEYEGIQDNEKEIERASKLSAQQNEKYIESFFMPDTFYRTFSKVNKDGKSYENIFKEIREKYTIRERIDGVPFWEEYKKRKSFEKLDEKNNKSDWTKIQAATRNEKAHSMAITWWCNIMKRAMRNLGYSFSRNYEDANSYDHLIESYEEAIKYPWMYDATYVALAKSELPIYKKKAAKRRAKQEAEASKYRKRFEEPQTYHLMTLKGVKRE